MCHAIRICIWIDRHTCYVYLTLQGSSEDPPPVVVEDWEESQSGSQGGEESMTVDLSLSEPVDEPASRRQFERHLVVVRVCVFECECVWVCVCGCVGVWVGVDVGAACAQGMCLCRVWYVCGCVGVTKLPSSAEMANVRTSSYANES